MTSADHRAHCIEAMKDGYYKTWQFLSWPGDVSVREMLTAAFDSLPSVGANVVPSEATEEMIYIGELVKADGGNVGKIFASMVKVGNLTNETEKKS